MTSQMMDSDNDIINKLRMDVVRLEAKLEISENALNISRESLEKRLDHMNEFRQALSDQASKFVTRHELAWVLSTAMFMTLGIGSLLQRVLQ